MFPASPSTPQHPHKPPSNLTFDRPTLQDRLPLVRWAALTCAGVPRWLALVLLVLVLGSRFQVAEARPQTDKKLAREAKKHLKAGLKHYKRGKMDKAIEELQ